MLVKLTISEITIALIIVFNTGIAARIGKILLDGQVDEKQDTGKMVRIHLIAAIVVDTITGLVSTIEKFYR